MMNFRSKLRRELFVYYFTNSGAEHYVRELAEILRVDPANLSRELAALEREGVFVSRTRGRQKYFRLNAKYPLLEEYRRIVVKTVGVPAKLRDSLSRVPGIREAHLYGSFARDQVDAASDIDLLVIGTPDAEQLETALGTLERRLRREINYTVLSPAELRARRAKRDPFLADIWRHKRVSLLPAHEKGSATNR